MFTMKMLGEKCAMEDGRSEKNEIANCMCIAYVSCDVSYMLIKHCLEFSIAL